MKVLLTGATGFVGPAVARALVAGGHAVRCLVRPTSDRSALDGVDFAVGALDDASSLGTALEGVEAVVHVAGLTKSLAAKDYYRVNDDGTRRLAEAALAAGARRFVYCSTLSAGGPSRVGRPVTEDDPASPVSHYGRSKLGGELALRTLADRLSATVVRPPIVYGPRDRDFFELFKMAARGVGLKPGLFGDKRYSVIHVDDLGHALALALARGKAMLPRGGSAGLYYVSDGGEHSWADLLRACAKAMGAKIRIVPVPGFLAWPTGVGADLVARLTGKPQIVSLDKAREGAQPGWICSIARARLELEFDPKVGLERGLAETAAWYRKHGWL